MRSALRIAAIFAAAAVAACFGAGPTPAAPTGATVVFAPPASTTPCSGLYIGDIAFGSDTAWAIVQPYAMQDNNCNGGTPTGSVDVFQFGLDGGNSSMIGTAGAVNVGNDQEPRIASIGGVPLWAYADTSSTGALTLGPSGMQVGASSGGVETPVNIVTAGSAFYIEATQTTGGTSVNDPNYPCCDNNNGGGQPGKIFTVGTGSGSAKELALSKAPMFECSTVDRCVASNGTSLYYFETPSGSTQALAAITALSLADSSAQSLGQIPNNGSVSAAVGITATPSTVAWAASVDYATATDPSAKGCVITSYDIASTQTTTLLSTGSFSCMGLGLDATENAAYFTIVQVVHLDDGNPHMAGIGIGRIDVATHDFTSIALGIIGANSGPRRVHPMGDDVYAIDPLAIARISKSAFVGVHDFTP